MHKFEAQNLKKSYGSQVALDDINVSIESGTLNFILGANGSGKSTLLKCFAGHENWNSGDIFLDGLSRSRDRKNFNADLHLVSEDIVLPVAPLSTLKALYQDLYESWDEATFKKFIEWGNLSLDKSLQGVSRGQKIQGLLALTLAVNPKVLLIDEATAVLDPFIRSRFMMEIDRRNKEFGMTSIIATNIGTEVAALKGRLLIMQKGKVIIDRSADTIAEGFVKVRIPASASMHVPNGFSFIEQNVDGSVSFLGMKEQLGTLNVEFQEDRRTITIDEVFIFFSDRNQK